MNMHGDEWGCLGAGCRMTVLYERLILRRLAEICRIEPSVGDFDLE